MDAFYSVLNKAGGGFNQHDFINMETEAQMD